MSWLWLVGRAIFGIYFVFNGVNHFTNLKSMTEYAQYKKVPMASAGVILSGLMLLVGGLSILTGYFILWGVIIAVIALLVITFYMHNFWTIEDPQSKMAEMSNFLKNWALIGALLMLVAIENWSWV